MIIPWLSWGQQWPKGLRQQLPTWGPQGLGVLKIPRTGSKGPTQHVHLPKCWAISTSNVFVQTHQCGNINYILPVDSPLCYKCLPLMFEQYKLLSNNCSLVTSYFKTSGLWRNILKEVLGWVRQKGSRLGFISACAVHAGENRKPPPWGALQEPKFTINAATFLILSFSQTA